MIDEFNREETRHDTLDKETWDEINLQTLVSMLYDNDFMVYDPKRQSFVVTSKGVFLLKFLNNFSPKFSYGLDKEFMNLLENLDWRWLYDNLNEAPEK